VSNGDDDAKGAALSTIGQGSRDWDGARYDLLAHPQERWGARVLEWMDLSGGETVLDAGCGSGRVTELLLRRVPQGRVVAVDSSPSMLSQARSRLAGAGDRVRFIRCDLLNLGPAQLDGYSPVDAVLSTATFHWVTDHDRLFSNLASVIREGGQLVAQCGAKGNIANVIAAAASVGLERPGTWKYASADETSERLHRAGFRNVEVWTHDEDVVFDTVEGLADFLEVVCLREALAALPVHDRRATAERVAEAMGELVIRYVRLNMVAVSGAH